MIVFNLGWLVICGTCFVIIKSVGHAGGLIRKKLIKKGAVLKKNTKKMQDSLFFLFFLVYDKFCDFSLSCSGIIL